MAKLSGRIKKSTRRNQRDVKNSKKKRQRKTKNYSRRRFYKRSKRLMRGG